LNQDLNRDNSLRRSCDPIQAVNSRWRREPAARKYPLLALIPVFNRAELLQQCLDALRPAVDGIIALDDGSTDETPSILRGEPKVIEIITKPPKSLAEWDDAANRFLLYEAAHAYAPDWLLCIDADEVLEQTFVVYKEQLMNQPPAIQGYAFPLVAIYEDKITGPLLVDRMYRFKPGFRYDSRRLHCRIIPLDITDEEIRTVNIRFFHYSASPRQKEERYNKYLVADPKREFQPSYENLLKTNPSRPLLPIGGALTIAPFADSTIEVQEFFPRVEDTSGIVGEYLLFLQSRLGELVVSMKEFHELRLNFFYIKSRLPDGKYLLLHRYDPSNTLEVSEQSAWVLERIRIRKDFFQLAAGFAATFDIEQEDCVEAFNSMLSNLKELQVLL
jgi:glycosyltransferase involved in cell wall biosynthesis